MLCIRDTGDVCISRVAPEKRGRLLSVQSPNAEPVSQGFERDAKQQPNESGSMEIEKTSALLVIDIQQEDFLDMLKILKKRRRPPRWDTILKGKRVLDVFHKKELPVIQVKEVHREDMVDFGRELDGSEGVHCIETSPYSDYAKLTYPIKGQYLISKRRYSAFFATDLEILLKGLKVDTLYMIGGLTEVCIHYTAVDAHQHDYRIRVMTDAVAGSSVEAHRYALKAIHYLQRDALVTTADIES